MAEWQCIPGSTLLIPSGPNNKKHLFVLILGPTKLPGYGDSDQIVHIGISSIYPDIPYDTACVLHPGDHPFITHDSYAVFRYARIDCVSHIQGMVDSGTAIPNAPCSTDLLQRVVTGMKDSRLAQREIKRLF
jgi:hypothetical protein